MGGIISLAFKDLLLLWRDRGGLFWVLGFPILFAVFFGSIFSGIGKGGASELSIAVVDQDSTSASRQFVEQLRESDALRVTEYDLTTARDRVRLGKLIAFVLLEEGFGEAGPVMFGGSSHLRIGIDPSRNAESAYLQGIIMQVSFEQYEELFSSPQKAKDYIVNMQSEIDSASGLSAGGRQTLMNFLNSLDELMQSEDTTLRPAAGFEQQIEVESVMRERSSGFPRSSFEITFPIAIMWALLGCAASFGISVVKERRAGTYLRLRLAPISRGQILAGKGLACWIACVGVSLLLLAFGRLVFGVTADSLPLLLLAIVVASLCFVGIMMAMSVIGKTEESVAGAGWAILMVLAMLGGGMVPLVFMPSWMKPLSNISPIKWSIVAIEGAIWRGFSPAEMMLPLLVLVGIGVLSFTVGVIRFSHYDR
jgi:ABC-2 type transport system permease protein